jgi:hypothetical protein
MKKKTKEKVVKLIDMFDSWKSAIEEVKHYLEQDVDCFTVSSGPWTITYDNTKESEVIK